MAEFADKEVCLISAEGEEFKVATKVAALSVMVQNIITEDDEDEKIVTLPNVSKVILAKVVEFGNHYVNEPMTEFVKVSPYIQSLLRFAQLHLSWFVFLQ